jgi:hypothetical protein
MNYDVNYVMLMFDREIEKTELGENVIFIYLKNELESKLKLLFFYFCEMKD